MATPPPVPSPVTSLLPAPVRPNDKRFLLTGILLLVSGFVLGVSLAVLFGRDHEPQRDPKFEAEQKELVEYQLRQIRNAEAKQIAERDKLLEEETARIKEREASQAAYAAKEIGRLKALRDKGWITQEQYDADIKSQGIGKYPH
jgi:hypothetical protein